MNAHIKNYNKPRPVWMAVLGDTLMYSSTTIAGMGIYSDQHAIAYVALTCGVLAQFFTKLFRASNEELQNVIDTSNPDVIVEKVEAGAPKE